jgi:tRNA pseudouridine38-40 synthase
MRTYKLVIEYAGTRFSGWQEQKNALTITGELRRALEAAGARVVEIGGAGRTDAGVHAIAQVAHVRLEDALDPRTLLRDVNRNLPADVNVLDVSAADARFHARHHAVSRSYVYQISTRRSAFAKRYVWWIEETLDVDAMRQACAACVGEHDFVHFTERAQDQPGTRVRMDRAEIAAVGPLVLLRFEASHFLWRMVRRLTGAIVSVGLHQLEVRDLVARLEPGSTAPGDARIAPASGLFLEAVRYPGDPALGPLLPAQPIAGGR